MRNNGIVRTAMAGVFVIGSAIAMSCDTARNLVVPVDNTPIETSGQTNFSVRIKPTGTGYETTINLTDLIIYDTAGNELPAITVDDIVVNVPKAEPPAEPAQPPNQSLSRTPWWLNNLHSKTDSLQPHWNCDNHADFHEDNGGTPDFHRHSIYHSHRHRHWTRGHSHSEGELVEDPGSILDQESNEEHTHVVFISHNHKHEPFNPPKAFHTHRCK